ncbi:hypothetical protein QJS10_CPB04g00294 [Acorus calamus]|uniref:Uncharacterized protein n=1 Tax=Acorus calamus TaxID=4465 RepID=A0AAV9EWW9_ACOCL|nr:hypothetical protein QJS10_CPB04g00294 [Acorus calamus]
MKISKFNSLLTDSTNKRSCMCTVLPAAILLCTVFFMGSSFVSTNYKERLSRLAVTDSAPATVVEKCSNRCLPSGIEALPKGIVSRTSNLEMQPLWGSPKKKRNTKSLLALAVGIKQKENVDKIVKKFPSSDFTVMLFHYDGFVDNWRDLQWSKSALHVSAINQTKWWFAKRFLHPDVVDEYGYIFLWDEDLGVEHFNPVRYLSIVKEEGLEISQPALDTRSIVHHPITARGSRSRTNVQILWWWKVLSEQYGPSLYRVGRNDGSSVFKSSLALCMNDLIHAWGLDMKLGYCAQGDRSKNVGVVDAEYVFHQGIATLGASDKNKTSEEAPGTGSPSRSPSDKRTPVPKESPANNDRLAVPSEHSQNDPRSLIRLRSHYEMEMFYQRWNDAVEGDECWTDPYKKLEP